MLIDRRFDCGGYVVEVHNIPAIPDDEYEYLIYGPMARAVGRMVDHVVDVLQQVRPSPFEPVELVVVLPRDDEEEHE